ncbi:MAG: sugar phosphate isomerase/epimerase family protein [bacterium]
MELTFGFSVVQNPIEDCLEYALEHNLTHLEIDLMENHSCLEAFDNQRLNRLKDLAGKFHLSLSLHTPYTMNLADKVSMIREANIAYLKKCIILAYNLGVTHVTTHLGNYYELPGLTGMRQNALQRLVLSLKKILSDCCRYKVKLALENVHRIPEGCGFLNLGDNIQDFEFLFSELKSDLIHLCLDVGHANTHEGASAYIQKFTSKIICVHYHDNHGRYDEHLDVGEGTLPWERIAGQLKQIGFQGPFISETFNRLKPHEVRDTFHTFF